jgi:hypothetical protein
MVAELKLETPERATMRSSMARKDPLLLVLLWWTAVVAGVLVWLPLVRGATQGRAYRWALAPGIGGSGTGGTYWVLPLAAVFMGTLLYLGWRGGRAPFSWLLLAFHVPLAAAVTYAAWSDPGGFRLEGATLGLDVSLAVMGPVLFWAGAGAVIVWVLRNRARRTTAAVPWAWTRATVIRVVLLITIVPLEVALFRSGGIQSPQNVIGVALVGWQWVLLNRVFAGARPS